MDKKIQTPKVSIVIPVYNVEKFLPQCLESAINQTLKEIEIICVNDGSTDSSLDILNSYAQKDERIKIINKENSGYGASMNRGLDMATGEYFAILESDDFCMPDAYETMYKTAKQFDADIVRSDYFDLTTPNNKIFLKRQYMSLDYSYYYRTICPNDEPEVYLFVMHNWTGIYKISYLRNKGVRYNETPGAAYQDNGFFFQFFSQNKPEILSFSSVPRRAQRGGYGREPAHQPGDPAQRPVEHGRGRQGRRRWQDRLRHVDHAPVPKLERLRAGRRQLRHGRERRPGRRGHRR